MRAPFEVSDVMDAQFEKELIDINTGFFGGNGLMTTVSLYSGIGYAFIKNLQLEVDGYRKIKKNSNSHNMYADVMFAPSVNFKWSEHIDSTTAPFVLDESIAKKRLGLRFGYAYNLSVVQSVSFAARVDMGWRPGFKTNSFFMYIGCGLAVNLIRGE